MSGKYSNKLRGICLLYSSCASFLKLVDAFFVLEGHFHEIFCVPFDGGKGCLWWFGLYGSCLGCRNGGMNIIYVFFLRNSCTITECLARLQCHLQLSPTILRLATSVPGGEWSHFLLLRFTVLTKPLIDWPQWSWTASRDDSFIYRVHDSCIWNDTHHMGTEAIIQGSGTFFCND